MISPGGPTLGRHNVSSGNPEVRAWPHTSPAQTGGATRPLFTGERA